MGNSDRINDRFFYRQDWLQLGVPKKHMLDVARIWEAQIMPILFLMNHLAEIL